MTSVFFNQMKSQQLYLIIMALLILVAILHIWVVAPESPMYLYEKGRFEELEECLFTVASYNGIKDSREVAKFCTDLLQKKQLKQEFSSCMVNHAEENLVNKNNLMDDPQTRNNLIGCCILWSCSGFITYLLIYYSKYFKGNFFYNYAIQGLSDGFSLFYVAYLGKAADTSIRDIVKFLLYAIIFFTLIQMTTDGFLSQKYQGFVVPILLLLIRLQVTSIQNFGYHIN